MIFYVFTGDNMNISDILGLGNLTNSFMSQAVGTPSTPTMQSSYTPLTPTSTNSPISPDAYNLTSTKTAFDAFQVNTISTRHH